MNTDKDEEFPDTTHTPHFPQNCYVLTCGGMNYDPCDKALETERAFENGRF